MRTRRDIDLDQCLAVVTWTAGLRARQRGQRAMRYVGKHRDVDFVVFHSSGAWKYIVGGETRVALRAGASLVDLDRILQGMDLQNSLRSHRQRAHGDQHIAGADRIPVVEAWTH
jgi:hypothetical protein